MKILNVAMTYFLDNFTTSQVTDAAAIYEKVSAKVSPSHNTDLLLLFTAD